MARDSFGSRFGAMVAMAGSAVGLGNLWRFPYLVGENGGAAFIIVYILLSFLICLPIFISEFVVGRRSQKNAYAAFRDLSGGSAWRWVGLFTIIVPLVVLSYYSVIGGWSVDYMLKSFAFSFTGGESRSAMATMFSDMVSSTWIPLLAHTGFLLVTTLIVVIGIKDGIEKFSKVMMPLLFFIVIAIAIYSLTLPGAKAGVDYLFNPDFSKIDAKACAAALGQAFFSLSLGFGTIMTYASYVDKKENIMFQSTATAVSDLMFALIAGVAIMPAVFAFGLNPQSGPGLVFETLPYVFGQMPAGGFIAILFFSALLVAALTSSISMLEVAVAYLVEEKKFSRISACGLLFVICWIVGTLCSLSFGPLSGVHIGGRSIFDFFDNLSSNILMTLGSLLTVLFVGWRLKKTDVYDEFTNGGTLSRNAKIFGVLWFLIRYVCPVAILAIFVTGLLA
ncbi:MAG: sodium-dependent transporter [Bacteroidales bacterium]|nr:sodium-dependent transporter [Bacteroidales bacterium]